MQKLLLKFEKKKKKPKQQTKKMFCFSERYLGISTITKPFWCC